MDREAGGTGGSWIWFGGLLLIVAVHGLWQALNRMPPVWDMAHHQLMGWAYLDAVRAGEWDSLPRLSNYYPPFYYLLEALFLGMGSSPGWLPFWTNLPGLFLLSFALFRLGREHGAWSGVLSGHLPLLFPLVAWTSRESLIDPWLTAWVALSYWLLSRIVGEEGRFNGPLFGLVVGLGLLTKWTFLLFLLPGLLFAGVRAANRTAFVRRLLDAALVAFPLTLWWYLPNLRSLMGRFESTAAAARWEMDPGLDSLLGWIYYPRCLFSYYLYVPLALIVMGAILYRLLSRNRNIDVVTVGLLGSIFLLTLLEAKDPRYVMPAAGLLASFVTISLSARPGWLKTAWVVAWLQFIAVSFSIPFLPAHVSLGTIEVDRDFRSMRQEWVFFQTDYFGISGPPRQEDWHYGELVDLFDPGDSVAVIPDAPRLNPSTLLLEARVRDKDLLAFRLGMEASWEEKIREAQWVIGKTDDQGISYITRYTDRVYEFLETQNWPLVKSWSLPDGSRLLLWRKPSR